MLLLLFGGAKAYGWWEQWQANRAEAAQTAEVLREQEHPRSYTEFIRWHTVDPIINSNKTGDVTVSNTPVGVVFNPPRPQTVANVLGDGRGTPVYTDQVVGIPGHGLVRDAYGGWRLNTQMEVGLPASMDRCAKLGICVTVWHTFGGWYAEIFAARPLLMMPASVTDLTGAMALPPDHVRMIFDDGQSIMANLKER